MQHLVRFGAFIYIGQCGSAWWWCRPTAKHRSSIHSESPSPRLFFTGDEKAGRMLEGYSRGSDRSRWATSLIAAIVWIPVIVTGVAKCFSDRHTVQDVRIYTQIRILRGCRSSLELVLAVGEQSMRLSDQSDPLNMIRNGTTETKN